MKPRDLLLLRIQGYLCAPLQSLGFKFARSKMVFSRVSGIAKQKIAFQLSHWNSEDDCTFWTNWSAHWPGYPEWHERHFNQPQDDLLCDLQEQNIREWSHRFAGRACLHNRADDAAVMQMVLNDFLNAGIPYLDSISSLEGAAEQILALNTFLPSFRKATDFFLMSGNQERALATLLNGIQAYSVGERFDQQGELPKLQLRLAKFFGKNDLSHTSDVSPPRQSNVADIADDVREGLLLSAVFTNTSAVVFEPESIVRELITYGEPEAAEKLTSLDPASLQAIGRRAYEISNDFVGGRGPMIVTAICEAVVEQIEGKRRPLKHKKRRYPKDEDDDSLVDELLASNPMFQALVAKSKAGPRKPFAD
jgi:hypothetical protein